jgi:predicted DCC family thiol-disulfide oxidoreductase YuxK
MHMTLYYDGHCPLCMAEIVFLQQRNDAGLLSFVDVCEPSFSSAEVGVSSCQVLLDNMHAKLADGTVLIGAEVFAAAYARAQLPTMAWIFSRPWLMPIWRLGYRFFARYRISISRRIGPTLLAWVSRRPS